MRMTSLDPKCGYTVSSEAPALASFLSLRATAGWGNISATLAEESLANTLFIATIYAEGQLLAMGRIVGDGALFYYIQDVVVRPDFQGRGYGRTVMEMLDQYIQREAKAGSTVGLFSAQGKEHFYSAFDYLKRCGKPLGYGMSKFVV